MNSERATPGFGSALVTGATGFLRLHLCQRLAACGVRTTAMVRLTSNADRVAQLQETADVVVTGPDTADITQTVLHARPDMIFHLAATYIPGFGPTDIAALRR
jgi:nucleoside-diphosphate-sugar epimerase